jgi:hypothetical protein
VAPGHLGVHHVLRESLLRRNTFGNEISASRNFAPYTFYWFHVFSPNDVSPK